MGDANKKMLETISSCSQRFALKLYKILREEEGNIFFSPTSLEMVLALAHMGARGKTAEEILTGLELPNNIELIKEGYKSILTSLKSADGMILEIANKVYCEQTFTLEQEFHLVADKFFLSAAENLDFINHANESCRVMNSWVEKQTHDKIKNLFAEGDITSDTKLVLINAVYFKGKWKHPFDVSRTHKEPFYTSSSESKEIDMMHLKAKFGYLELEELNAKMLVMPYVGEKMFMVILLPNEIDGLREMEKKLHSVKIGTLMKQADEVDVIVTLPRFKIEKTMDLGDPLKKLGINSMFDPNAADFSGISKVHGLYVSKVVQKAFIEVNEEGSEAAAATGMMMMKCSMVLFPKPTPIMKVDHPFICYIVNVDIDSMVFQGHIMF